MNISTITGSAVKDFELRYTQTGKAVASGTIAVQRKFKNANGEYDSDFIDLVAWGKTGELLAEYVRKGNFFGVSGSIQTRMYEKKDGSKAKVTEVNVQEFDFPIKPRKEELDGEEIDDKDLPF